MSEKGTEGARILDTGRRQRQQAPRDSERVECGEALIRTWDKQESELVGSGQAPWPSWAREACGGKQVVAEGVWEALGVGPQVSEADLEGRTVVVSAASFVELIEKYRVLQRERVVANALALIGFLLAMLLLAVQVVKVLW